MNGLTWMDKLLKCEQARKNLPLELQATIPLPGRRGEHTAECWYYRLECQPSGLKIYSPERYVLWNVKTMEIQEMKCMEAVLLGSGADLMTKMHREQEDVFLKGPFTDFLNGESAEQDEITSAWLAAMPQEMRQWIRKALKEAF